MNTLYHDIVIDLAHMGYPESVTVKQYDDQIPHVRVELRQNGVKYVIPSGTTLRMQGTKPDKTHFMHDVIRTDDGRIDCPLTNQILAAEGPILAEIRLTDTTGELATFNFYILAQKAALSREDIESSDDYQSIDKIKADTLQYKKDAEAAKAAAEAAKEAAAGSANTATQKAQTAQLEAQKVKQIVAGNEAYTKIESDLKYTVAPRKEASSSTGELKLTDADYGLSYLELQGNSEQYTNTANKNLIDLHFCTYGYIDNGSPGVAHPNAMMSGFIRCDISKSYILNIGNGVTMVIFVFYDKDKNRLGHITNSRLTANPEDYPSGTYWMRVNMSILNKDQMQLEEGIVSTAYVQGAVETPSPEYPSELRSVGDIPKDSNGVEIKNIVDIDGVLARPDSDWTVSPSGRSFSIPLDVSKQKIGGRLFEAISNTRFNLGLSNNSISLGDSQGFYLAAPSIPYKSFDFSSSSAVRLFIYVSGSDPIDLAMVKEILDKERNKFLFTYASEVDEYRPYIGENNGLVKIESQGKNLFEGKGIVIGNIDASGAPSYNAKVFRTDFIELDSNKQYVFNPGTYTPYIYLYDINKTFIRPVNGVSKFNSENANYVILQFNSNPSVEQTQADIDNMNKTLQLEEGTQATEYQPYHQQITWIPLREPLRSVSVLGGYTDTVDKNGNITVRVAKRHLKDLLIGGVRVSYGYNDDTYFTASYNNPTQSYDKSTGLGTYPNKDFTINKMLSQMFKRGYIYGGYEIMLIMGLNVSPHYISTILRYDRLGLTSSATDAELGSKLIEWLAFNDPIVYLGIEEGSQFIDLYKYQIPVVYIETYDQETNVRCLNKVKPSTMGLDYKLAISSLIKRLEALESTAVTEVNKNV